jgi:hypothetical protein
MILIPLSLRQLFAIDAIDYAEATPLRTPLRFRYGTEYYADIIALILDS